jgi:hypothetical protein
MLAAWWRPSGVSRCLQGGAGEAGGSGLQGGVGRVWWVGRTVAHCAQCCRLAGGFRRHTAGQDAGEGMHAGSLGEPPSMHRQSPAPTHLCMWYPTATKGREVSTLTTRAPQVESQSATSPWGCSRSPTRSARPLTRRAKLAWLGGAAAPAAADAAASGPPPAAAASSRPSTVSRSEAGGSSILCSWELRRAAACCCCCWGRC